MLRMVWLLLLLDLSLLGFTGAGQTSIEVLNLYDASPEVLAALSHSDLSIAASLSDDHLNEVSSSVVTAETWLRTNVLAHYPATKITTIMVGSTLFCQGEQVHNLAPVLPSLKNIYHSLIRWGLEKDIKVSSAFSFNCLQPNSALFRDGLAKQFVKPVLEFLHDTNSTFTVNLPPNFSLLPQESISLISSLFDFITKIESFEPTKINVILTNRIEEKTTSRKLASIESKIVNPYPARPTPLPDISQAPLHSSIGFSVPANVAKIPLPPLSHAASPPSLSFPFTSPPPRDYPFAPEMPPVSGPAATPYGFTFPPCNPAGRAAPGPETGVAQKLWCVAKPSVPAETLQEAMDYACGAGGADCQEIMSHGSCFYPDTIVAHASYAFNNYWQKTKRHGGTCSFGGTAMIINSDPSFLHCRFVLS